MTPLRRRARLALLLCAWSVMAIPGAAQKVQKPIPLESIAPLDLAHLLDTYAAGRFDDAVRAVAAAGDVVGQHLRRHWMVTGQAWIDANQGDRANRALVAAALALESEQIRVERGQWGVTSNPPCAGPCVLDWAQLQLVQRGAPDAAERAWYLAAASLAGGVRDWRYLQRTVAPTQQSVLLPGLMDRALERFPGDVNLRFERALASAGRFTIVTDGATPPLELLTPAIRISGRGGTPPLETVQENAATLLAELASDPEIGAEARVRLGYLQWALGHDDASRVELAKAAAEAHDADVRYLAEFLLGWTAMIRGDEADAHTHLAAALTIRPASESASIAMAAVALGRGDASHAFDVAQATLDRRGHDLDPWRQFLYGHHPLIAGRIAELRKQVHP